MGPGIGSDPLGICLETLLPDPLGWGAGDFERAVRAAGAAGFRSAALRETHADHIGVRAMRGILDDNGVSARVVECVTRWDESPGPPGDALDAHFDVVTALGADMVLAISRATTLELPRAADAFAVLCERARERRGLRFAIEFIPCRALVDLSTAWGVVRESGAPNGGLVLDLMHWHLQPGGPDLDLLRTIPGEHLHYVQVCDAAPGPPPAPEEYITTALRARPLPGDGIVDIQAVFETLDAIGADPFYALEVFNADLVAQGPEAMAARLRRVANTLGRGAMVDR